MLTRLGSVVYGVGVIWGAFFVILGTYGAVNPKAGGGDMPGTFFVIMALIGLIGFSVGWAFRYVVTDR